jgi:hypothetical protein
MSSWKETLFVLQLPECDFQIGDEALDALGDQVCWDIWGHIQAKRAVTKSSIFPSKKTYDTQYIISIA